MAALVNYNVKKAQMQVSCVNYLVSLPAKYNKTYSDFSLKENTSSLIVLSLCKLCFAKDYFFFLYIILIEKTN